MVVVSLQVYIPILIQLICNNITKSLRVDQFSILFGLLLSPARTSRRPGKDSATRKVRTRQGLSNPQGAHLVYFISSVLRDARERYPMMQKLLMAILIASHKMRPYFEGHPITVVSSTI